MFSIDTRKMAAFGAAGFIATALVVAAVSPAHSQPPLSSQPVTVIAKKDTLTRVVSYADLSLASKEGRGLLLRRVNHAVREVCPSSDPDNFTLQGYDVQGCKDFAWAGARPQIKRAIERAQSGATLAMSITISTASVK